MDKKQDPTLFKEFSGLRNDVDPERFTTSDLSIAKNVDIDKSGRLSRRTGFAALLRTAAHSLWSDGTTALFVSGSNLKRLNLDMSAALLKAGFTLGARMAYASVANRVFFANGYEKGVLDNGAVRSWGLPVPPLPGVTIGHGIMPAGVYQFVLTVFRADGQESGARAAGSLNVPADSSLQFDLPPATDAAVYGIYLSPPNGDALYLALTVPAGTTQATYNGDTVELNLPLATQFMSAPPAGHLVVYFKGRMFMAVGDALYYSEPFAYELFDLRRYIPLDGRATLLAVLEEKEREGSGGLFIGTDKSCGMLVGADPDTFEYVPRMAYGAILGALDYVDGALFDDNSLGARPLPMWLTTQGICVGAPGMEIRNLTRTKYGFSAAGEGAALFKPGPNQFIATSTY